MAKYCPDCSVLLGGQDKCKHCGWFEGGKSNNKRKTDPRCSFSNGNERCPLNGTRSINLRGQGPWLCSFHFKHQDDPMLSANVLDNIIQNNPFKNYNDWRDELVDENKMNLGKMDKTAKIDTMNYMCDVINGVTGKKDVA